MITINKQTNKDFVILNLTDPQLGASEWEDGHLHRNILEYTVRELIKRTNPDLITVSGDLAWAGQEHAYDMIGSFLDSFQIPWAFVWGNHDNQEGAEFVNKIADKYMALKHSVYEKGDAAIGNGNYVITIKEGEKIVEALILMDSHDRAPFIDENGQEQSAWAKLTPPQMAWYQAQIHTLKGQGCTSATAIMHIPPYGYLKAAQAAYKPSVDLKNLTLAQADGADCWNDGYEKSCGVQYEGIACYPQDDGVLEIIKAEGLTKRIVVGHDHVNNFMIEHEGIQLIYALKTGAGCYWNPLLNGGTVLKVSENGVYEVKHEYVDISHLIK